jgi:hypothetical protein
LKGDQLLAKLTNGPLTQYLVVDVAELQGLTIREAERFVQEWTPLRLCWRVVQKWIDKCRRDRTNLAYNAVKEIANEILTDELNFLEADHDRWMWNERPLDLTYWTLRFHLSIDANWHINRTVAPLYAWRMLNVHDAELHLGDPGGAGTTTDF